MARWLDKSAAQARLNELVRKAERMAAGIEDPFDKHRKRPLKDHAEDFIQYLRNKASNADYVQGTKQQIESILNACKFSRLDQISASRVQEFLANCVQLVKVSVRLTTTNEPSKCLLGGLCETDALTKTEWLTCPK